MQHRKARTVPTSIFFAQSSFTVLLIVLAFVGPGCGPAPVPAPIPKPFADAQLTVACPDLAWAKELQNRGAVWSARTGAKLEVVAKTLEEVSAADVGIVRTAEIGKLAQANMLQPLPSAFRAPDHPMKWDTIVDAYRIKNASWGQTPYALPICGDGIVMVYRQDLFDDPAAQEAYRSATGRTLEAPRTWEEVASIGKHFTAKLGKPALPPIPNDGTLLLHQFQQIAACYDRKPAQFNEIAPTPGNEAANAVGAQIIATSWQFHFHGPKHEIALTSPAFLAAAEWFHSTKEFRPASGDRLAALTTGSAVLAPLSLAEVARLPRGSNGVVDGKYGIAAMPGTAIYFDEEGKAKPGTAGRNSIPFLGGLSWNGVVLKSGKNGEAAWDFLAEIAGVTGSQITLSNVDLGSGPFRVEHTSEGKDRSWEVYGFDADRTKALSSALRDYAPYSIVNPALVLRLPDQDERIAALEQAIRATASGSTSPKKAMQRAQQVWQTLDAKAGSELPQWHRRATGLD